MQIYADVVFLINACMDVFIFWIVNKLTGRKAKRLRVVMGGLAMAVLYCLLLFFASLHDYLNVFASVVILMIGIVIAFRPARVKEFASLLLLSYVVAFAVGGMGVAFFYLTNISDVIGSMIGFTVRNFSLKILLASSSAAYVIVRLSLVGVQKVLVRRQVFFPVTIYYGDGHVSLTALLDTGNTLVDPITHVPVLVAEFNAVREFLPEKLQTVFGEKKENDLALLVCSAAEEGFSDRIRMIPFTSLGRQNGMLLGFRPDKVEIIDSGESVKTLPDIVIGIYNFTLSRDGRYQGLLNPESVAGY